MAGLAVMWFVLVNLTLFTCAVSGQIIPYKEYYIDQFVDHFNYISYGTDTYKQRYLVQDKWWKKGEGPIFFYTGNESPIDAFWENSGFLFDIAPEFGALVVFAEHRFYGKSLPFGNNSFNHPYIGLLSIEQAMGDYAYLINHLKETLNATQCPVITFGGSYGGMLSAYMRFKYPNLVTGSIAASAPIYLLSTVAKRDFFFEDVSNDFAGVDQECFNLVKSGFIMMKQLAEKGTKGYQKLSEVFRTCKTLSTESEYQHLLGWIRNSFTNLAMFDYPYPTTFMSNLPAYPIKLACSYIMKNDNPLYGLANAAGLFYNGTDGKLKCFDIFTDFVECADPTGCGVGPTSWAWDFQACTEVSLVSGSNNMTDMFPEMPFTPQIRQKYCKKRWNVTPRQEWKSLQFWGKDISTASNIVFSNGDLDPWRRGGVLSSSNPNIATLLIKGGAHHLDLRGHNPQDPPTVIQARETEKAYIHKWIKSHWDRINQKHSLYEKIKTWITWMLFHY